ncbi:MAG: Amidase enhancer precursor [Candidatus Dependentiae bacterium ADurb.Bin331]|nr:MAG: Amidase enhancer precursor [Candidatus Dependentiae bacterium ADurb.Bin331]
MPFTFKLLSFLIVSAVVTSSDIHARFLFGRKKNKITKPTPHLHVASTPSKNIHEQSVKKETQLVRVLLAQNEQQSHQQLVIKSKNGFYFIPADGKAGLKFNHHEISITSNAHHLLVNRKKVNYSRFVIKPIDGYLHFDGKEYHGVFLVEMADKKIHLINCLDLEEYVYSVLNSESWPGWPLEVNKAFAIACRSYVLNKIQVAVGQKKIFHIKNTNIHQTYNGVHESEKLREAVEQTRGIILTHNKKPIEAMFDSCCGGIIPAHIGSVDFTKAPYLARKKVCNFCKTCKIYSWKIEYQPHEFELLLRNAGHHIKAIKDIKIIKYDKAGLVEKVRIDGTNKTLQLTGKELYSLCSKIKSFCYKIEKKGKKICFSGRGYGHQVGICQWGARRMVDAGHHYKSILQFYYPGATFMQLQNS